MTSLTRRGIEKGSNSIFISIAAPPVGAFKGDGKRFKNFRMHTMLVTLGLRGNTFDSGNGICSWVRAVKDTVSVVCRNINMLTKN